MARRRSLTRPTRKEQVAAQLHDVLELLKGENSERLLFELINIYSPSWQELEVLDYCARYLEARGVELTRQPVARDGRYNIIARIGEGPIGLLFLGHVDTVVRWYQSEFRARAHGGVVQGLGSADMKSGCAAMMEAFCALAVTPHPAHTPAIGLALVVGEEDDGDGIQVLIQSLKPELAVVGEPTNMRFCHEHYGFSEMLLTTHGRRAHSALPEMGHNAIEAMFTVVNGLNRCLSEADPARSRPALVCNLRELRGGSNAFVVPEYCEAVLDVHTPPSVRVEQLNSEVQERMADLSQQEPEHRCELRFRMAYNGYALRPDDPGLKPLIRACQDLGVPPIFDSFRSHSDANCLRSIGTLPIVIGPGDLETAHTIDERVPLIELHYATRLYAAMGVRYREERLGGLRR